MTGTLLNEYMILGSCYSGLCWLNGQVNEPAARVLNHSFRVNPIWTDGEYKCKQLNKTGIIFLFSFLKSTRETEYREKSAGSPMFLRVGNLLSLSSLTWAMSLNYHLNLGLLELDNKYNYQHHFHTQNNAVLRGQVQMTCTKVLFL